MCWEKPYCGKRSCKTSIWRSRVTFATIEAAEIDCTFDVYDKNIDLNSELKRIQKEAELAVREGVKHIILTDEKVSETRIAIPINISDIV